MELRLLRISFAALAVCSFAASALADVEPINLRAELEEVSPYSFPTKEEIERLMKCRADAATAYFSQEKNNYLSSEMVSTFTPKDSGKLDVVAIKFVDTKKITVEYEDTLKNGLACSTHFFAENGDPIPFQDKVSIDLKDYSLSNFDKGFSIAQWDKNDLVVVLDSVKRESKYPTLKILCERRDKSGLPVTLGALLTQYGMKDMDVYRAPESVCKEIEQAKLDARERNRLKAEAATESRLPFSETLKEAVKGKLVFSGVGETAMVGDGYHSQTNRLGASHCMQGEDAFAAKPISQRTFIVPVSRVDLAKSEMEYEVGTTVSDLWRYLENPHLPAAVTDPGNPAFRQNCGDMYIAAIEYGAGVGSMTRLNFKDRKKGDIQTFARILSKAKAYTEKPEPDIEVQLQEFEKTTKQAFSAIGIDKDQFRGWKVYFQDKAGVGISSSNTPLKEVVKTLPSDFKFRNEKRDRQIVAIRLLPYPKPKKKKPQGKLERTPKDSGQKAVE